MYCIGFRAHKQQIQTQIDTPETHRGDEGLYVEWPYTQSQLSDQTTYRQASQSSSTTVCLLPVVAQ